MENLTVTGLVRLIGAGATMIYVVTDNERRTEQIATQAAARLKGAGSPYVWTCTEGFSRDGAVVEGIDDPVAAVGFALAQPGPLLFLFKDLPWFWGDNPYLIRALKDFAMRAKAKAIVVLGQQEGIPAALREEFVILQQGLPAMEEIKAFFEQARARDPQLAQACQERPGLLNDLVVAAQGLDLLDVERGMRGARAAGEAGGEGLVRSIFETKRAIIRTGGIMEFVANDVTPDQVGGMENLKQWMARREQAFGLEGISSGANLPKGVLMMGIAGCGKSLFVKAIAATWRLPLIRLDMAAVYDGSYGTPESSLRKAFRTAERWPPVSSGSTRSRQGSPPRGSRRKGGRRPASSARSSPGCRRSGPRSSWPPPPTPSRCSRPRSSARGASTRSSTSGSRKRRGGRRSSAFT